MTEKNPYILERKYSPFTTTSGISANRNFPGATTKKKKKGGPPYGPAFYSFEKAFAPTPLDTTGGGSLVWSGINANGVNIGSNTATGPAGPATEGILTDKFTAFLESLKTEENTQIIKIIKTGFDACFEAENISQKKIN